MLLDITEPVVQMLGYGLTYSGSASLSGESDASSDLFLIAAAECSISAESDLVSSAALTAMAESTLSGESDVVADGYLVWKLSASMSAEATLAVTVKVINAAASIVIGSSELVATSTRLQFGVPIPMSETVVGTFTCSVGHPVAGRPFVASSALTATIYTNPRLLVLPTVEYAYTNNVLLERYPIDNGQALLITNGVGELLDFPAQQLIADAEYYFGGGRRNELTPEEEAAVVAAGYGEYIETEFLS